MLAKALSPLSLVNHRQPQGKQLQALRATFGKRKSRFHTSFLPNGRLIKFCRSLNAVTWEKIPNIFDWQLASVFWVNFGDQKPLCYNKEFVVWFARERARHNTQVAEEFFLSLLENWPSHNWYMEEIIHLIIPYLNEFQPLSSDGLSKKLRSVTNGSCTINTMIGGLCSRGVISPGLERHIWKSLLKGISNFPEVGHEKTYYGLAAALELGFENGQFRWPDLIPEALEMLVPKLNLETPFSVTFSRFAVDGFSLLTEKQKTPLSKEVVLKLEEWFNYFKAEGLDASVPGIFDDKGTLELLVMAAKHSSTNACYLLGSYHHQKNSDLAIEYLSTAANRGHARAQALLSDISHTENGNSLVSLEDACRWEIQAFQNGQTELLSRIKKLSDEGNSDAQVALGASCLKDNPQQAVSLFNKAMQKNNPEAIFRMAILYSSGDLRNVPQNREESLRLYHKLKGHSHPKGLHHLALQYRLGLFGEKAEKVSHDLYRKAADLGDISAAYTLGCLLLNERNSVVNIEQARNYLLQAAIGGHISAQSTLNKLVDRGYIQGR